VAVHPPDVCYGTAGFTAGPARAEALADGQSVWVADFTRAGPQADALRIRWAWSDGGAWVASGSPRTAFASSPLLYKLYLIRPLHPKTDPADGPTELDLFRDLLPGLQANLSPH
jgi:hypothetical protein